MVCSMDLRIREFQNAIEVFVKNSDLPMEVKRLVMNEIMDKITQEADNEIKFQILEREQAEAKLSEESEVSADAENV